MAELDKKVQKAQTDLVQSVLEAQEKRNTERVEMLITNAIKQLKLSRFKPDLATCLSLANLARICPKIFNQSNVIKEILKSLLRRDNGPANIKNKTDIVVPVLAANILLASCDSTDVRQIILVKIEQWLNNSSQKPSDLIQHLLATICMKCQNDQQSIDSLIEMRHHWLLYLDENHDIYNQAPVDLCAGVRKLLRTETNCEFLLVYLKFLTKHDTDIQSFSREISKFIIDKPISIECMLNEPEYGVELYKTLSKIYIKLLTDARVTKSQIKNLSSNNESPPDSLMTKTEESSKIEDPSRVIVKIEPVDHSEQKIDSSIDIKPAEQKPITTVPLVDLGKTKKLEPGDAKNEEAKKEKIELDQKDMDVDENTSDENTSGRILNIKLPSNSDIVQIHKISIDAIFTLLSWYNDQHSKCREEYEQLLSHFILAYDETQKLAYIYPDIDACEPYDIPDHLRLRMAQSSDERLIEFSLIFANAKQLLKLLHLFGLPIARINKILKELESIKDMDQIRNEIKDMSFSLSLLEFYQNMGASGAQGLHQRLEAIS